MPKMEWISIVNEIENIIILLLQPNDHKKEVHIQNIAFSHLLSLQWIWFENENIIPRSNHSITS